MAADFLPLIAGLIYGYAHPGRENKTKLLKKAPVLGFGIGILFTLYNLLMIRRMGVQISLTSFIVPGIMYYTVPAVIIFTVGTFIGSSVSPRIKVR